MLVVPDRRTLVRPQVFWEGSGELRHWYAYVNRAPMLPGHVMLATDEPGVDVMSAIPCGLEAALREVVPVVLAWATEYKAPGCLPVLARMNLAAEQFRLHVVPLSPDEIAAASQLLHARHPQLEGCVGGGLYFLGQAEHVADGHDGRLDAAVEEAAEQFRRILSEARAC